MLVKKKNQQTETPSSSFWRSVFGGIMGTVLVLSLVGVLGFGLLSDDQPTAYSQEDLIEFESTITQTVQDTQEAVVSVGNYQSVQTNPFGQEAMLKGKDYNWKISNKNQF